MALEGPWQVIRSASAARELGAEMAHQATLRPWVVVSTASGERDPRFDMRYLVDQLEGAAHLIVLVNGEASWEWGVMHPQGHSVFGGAGRVYPAGYQPEGALEPRPIRLPHSGHNPARLTERLISDALTLAQEAGVFSHSAPHLIPATATITGFVGEERALVTITESSEMATLAAETTYPGVPLEWLFGVNQVLEGRLDTGSHRFLLDTPGLSDSEVLGLFPEGTVTWGFVVSVERAAGVIRIHPGVDTVFTREEMSHNPKDRVDLLLAPGEVVPVRVYRDAQGHARVRMHDIDDDEVVLEALSFGAGPWLVEGRERTEEEPDEDHYAGLVDASLIPAEEVPAAPSPPAPRRPVPGPGVAPALEPPTEESSVAEPSSPVRGALASVQIELATARTKVQYLSARLQTLGGDKAEELYRRIREERNHAFTEATRLREELGRAKADLAEWRKKARDKNAISTTSGPWARRARFGETEQWWREEVRRAWISVYTPHERKRWVLDDNAWVIGPHFESSLEGLKDSQVRRLTKLVLHIVSGRSSDEQLFEVHPLREGEGMGEANVVREDGALCLRAYVEEGVPQSKRLHYWQRTGSPIELSRVVQHDDMQP